MSRFSSTAALSLLLASACDRGGEQAPAKANEGATETKPAEPEAESAKPSDATKPDDATTSDAATTSKATGPRPPPPQSFEQALEPLTRGATPSADAEKAAWKRYKAKEYAEAQRWFALASLHDPVQWKHPFNLACASALADDALMVQVALVEAVRRDVLAAGKKIRSDDDLARYRSAEWFEPILRGEDPARTPPPMPTDPVAPPTPTPTPTPTPAPSGAGQPLPVGIAKPLAKPKLEQLRDQLAEVHGLRPVVRGSLETTNANGELVAWAVYDYSRYDACVLTQSKKACRSKLGADQGDEEEGEGEGEMNEMKCTDQWLVRATFGTTLIVDAPQPLKIACTADKLRRLDLVDIDGDGQQEVVLDISGSSSLEGFRESEAMDVGRVVKILRLDGTSQFDFSLAWVAVEITPDSQVAKRVFVRDTNADGHLDLVIESVQFMAIVGSDYDLDFWPTGDEEEQDIGPVKAEIWLYDPKADAWTK